MAIQKRPLNLVVWIGVRDAKSWGPKERVRNTSSGRRGGRGPFFVRESPTPLAFAKFFSTLVPNAAIEKISAKAVYGSTVRPKVFTNEDSKRPHLGTLRYEWVVITVLDSFRCSRDDADKSANGDAGGSLGSIRLCFITPGGPGNVEMCPGHTVCELL
jgi:hypothetical protein